MRKTLARNVLRTSAFALACLASAGAEVKADLITTTLTSTSATPTTTTTTTTPTTTATVPDSETYTTAGSVGTTGVTNSNGDTSTGPVGFTAVNQGSFGLNSQVSLGSFTVSALADGSTTTYNNTPFTITYTPMSITTNTSSGSGVDKFPNQPLTISGVLNGYISGNSSTVVATFDKVLTPVFSTPDGTYVSTISIANNPLSLVPSTTGGDTTIQASVTTTAASSTAPPSLGSSQQTPEPTTFAILGTAIVGLGLRQRLRSARKSA